MEKSKTLYCLFKINKIYKIATWIYEGNLVANLLRLTLKFFTKFGPWEAGSIGNIDLVLYRKNFKGASLYS